jgi:hypothetical protein
MYGGAGMLAGVAASRESGSWLPALFAEAEDGMAAVGAATRKPPSDLRRASAGLHPFGAGSVYFGRVPRALRTDLPGYAPRSRLVCTENSLPPTSAYL